MPQRRMVIHKQVVCCDGSAKAFGKCAKQSIGLCLGLDGTHFGAIRLIHWDYVFAKIDGMIADMIEKLEQEAAEATELKQSCDKNMCEKESIENDHKKDSTTRWICVPRRTVPCSNLHLCVSFVMLRPVGNVTLRCVMSSALRRPGLQDLLVCHQAN